ncbi:MAG: isoprenylcysteine carboxylmethyltransferase family protein [Candidatus Angelobacter sp. Gp1-AA117]|nr:MAG: isoprenylcysteine carboxylmethyltransferase family protein [Candidatus Angelobacter sp. Gp1-AA117]
MPSWSRIATRFRVPLGFLFAAAYLWFAHPGWLVIEIGFVFVALGLLMRAAASGHIRKNAQLATTGPYAYTRNPLYLGSILIAVGFIIASRNLWIAVATMIMFLAIYLPVIRAEETYLRSAFPEYAGYAEHVPRLLPRRTPWKAGTDAGSPVFSGELYMRHREYNALIGSLLMFGVLILKMTWYKH